MCTGRPFSQRSQWISALQRQESLRFASIRSSPVTVSRMRRAKHSLRNFLYVNGEEVEGIPFAFAVRIRVEEVFEGYQAPGADSF